jgi:hypothetical protein
VIKGVERSRIDAETRRRSRRQVIAMVAAGVRGSSEGSVS